MLRDYEVTYIINIALDEEAITAVVERVNHLIVTGGGTVTEVHSWGRRRLAYPITHNRDGFYVTTRFSMPTQSMLAFENDLRLNENILRHGAFRQDEIPVKPAIPLSQTPTPVLEGAAPQPLAVAEPAEPLAIEHELIDPELIPSAFENETASPEPVPAADK